MTRLLIAGIGNIFLGDDAFGVEVARRLAGRPLPEGVRVVDFGIRGLDLAFALLDGCDGAVLVDAAQRGGPPGTLYVLEPERDDLGDPEALEAHGLHPAKVLRMVEALGGRCPWLRVVGCEPATFGSDEDPAMGLSGPVQAAVDEAVRLVEALSKEFLDGEARKLAR
jgi:hydrogenase maturation protease